MKHSIVGSMTALITPFKNRAIDTLCYESLIKRQIDQGIDVIVPVGTTGESATLTHDEHKECIEIAVNSCNNSSVNVLAGCGSNSTKEAISLAQHAQKVGADAILSVTPYYNKPSQEGLYEHYRSIAQAVDIPVMLYNVPSRTGVDLKADTVIKLFNDVDNIYAIKEATGSLERCTQLLSQCEELEIISGDDAIDFPMMANGASGIISVTANLLPGLKSQLVNAVKQQDFNKAKMLNNRLYEMNSALFCESNPIPIKAAMYLAGILDHLEYRLPLTMPSKSTLKKLEAVLENYEVIK